MTFQDSAWLFVIPPALAVLAALAAMSKAPLRRGPRAVSTLLRAAMIALVAVALAGPMTTVSVFEPRSFAVLADLSRSLGREGRRAVADRIDAMLLRAPATARFRVAGFASGTAEIWSGNGARPLPADVRTRVEEGAGAFGLDPMVSDLGAALRVLGPAAALSPPGEIIVLTDGALPAPDAVTGDGGPKLILVPVAGDTAANRTLDGISATSVPRRPDEGAAFDIRFTLPAGGATAIDILVDDVPVRRLEVPGSAGPNVASAGGIVLASGPRRIVARFAEPDAEPLDDAAGLFLVAPAPEPVLVVAAPRGDRDAAIVRALRVQGLDVSVSSPEDFLAGRVRLSGAAALVLDGVDIAGAGEDLAKEVAAEVTERGLGLLVFPPPAPDALIAALGRPLASLLPLEGEPDPPAPPPPAASRPESRPGLSDPDAGRAKPEVREAPSLIVLLVIDCSDSMKQDRRLLLAKEGAIAAAAVLAPQDRIGVLGFNDAPFEVLPVTPARDQDVIADRIARLRAQGGTDFGPALRFAQSVLGFERAQIKHVILVSDGFSKPARFQEIVSAMREEGITVSTLGVGRSDVTTLSNIALWGGGRFYEAYSPDEIPQILTVQVEKVVAARKGPGKNSPPPEGDGTAATPPAPEPPPPPAPAPPPGEAAAAGSGGAESRRGSVQLVPARPWPGLRSVDIAAAPPLHGILRSRERTGAWTTLRTDAGLPALAHWRAGAGRVMLFAAPSEGGFARDLTGWDDYPKLWAQAVRFLARSEAERTSGLVITAVAEDGHLLARADDFKSRAAVADVAWELTDTEGRAVEAPMALFEDGSAEFRLPASCDRSFLRVTARGRSDARSAFVDVPVPPPAEVRDRGLSLDRLTLWARARGGDVIPDPAAHQTFADVERAESRTRPLPFLLGALLLLPVDLLVKRAFRRVE